MKTQNKQYDVNSFLNILILKFSSLITGTLAGVLNNNNDVDDIDQVSVPG